MTANSTVGHGPRLVQKTTQLSCFKTEKAENQLTAEGTTGPWTPSPSAVTVRGRRKAFLYVAEKSTDGLQEGKQQ